MILIVGLLALLVGGLTIVGISYAIGWGTMSDFGPDFIVSGLSIHLAALLNGFVLLIGPWLILSTLILIFKPEVLKETKT